MTMQHIGFVFKEIHSRMLN